MEDEYFKNDAKSITDLLFVKNYFNEKVTRDDMSAIEELIEHLLQSRFDSYVRVQKLLESIKSD